MIDGTGGNSLGQRLIMEEFLFLDKANRDIGNDLFFDVKKLIPLGIPESQNLRLYNHNIPITIEKQS